MKLVSFLLLFIFSVPMLSQERVLEIYQPEKEKQRSFKENRRVKVKTLDGKKYIGRFRIIDSQTIEIEGHQIALNNIKNIKSRSIVAGIAGTLLTIYGASLVLAGTLMLVIAPDIPLAVGFMSAGGLVMTSGILFNEFARNQRNPKWFYKIIEE